MAHKDYKNGGSKIVYRLYSVAVDMEEKMIKRYMMSII